MSEHFNPGDVVEYIGRGFIGFDPTDRAMQVVIESVFDVVVIYKGEKMAVRRHEIKGGNDGREETRAPARKRDVGAAFDKG